MTLDSIATGSPRHESFSRIFFRAAGDEARQLPFVMPHPEHRRAISPKPPIRGGCAQSGSPELEPIDILFAQRILLELPLKNHL